MSEVSEHRSSGAYTANLLGNIKSHLAGLQGYDVMVLELIQNADDAKAEEIFFKITDNGLLVRNSGRFTYCGDLDARPCSFIASNHSSCDYHRIADVGSGGKLANGENIGRFGIGFVSTYQVTDHPEIRSSGVKLTLYPEEGRWFIESFDDETGTSFFLPWADNPNTEARLALGISHVNSAHIARLAEDFKNVLRRSILFLRHVRKAEVWRDDELLLACDLDRDKGSDLIVSFRPTGEVEYWNILRADVTEAAERLYAVHPRLQALHRSTNISIGLRVDPELLANGLLFAYLPTEQSTGLPLHINADFFPEPDRKALIFAGYQHEQAWNEMFIDAAATELSRDPEGLLGMLGDIQLWQIFGRAFELSKSSTHPTCFNRFWERLKETAPKARIARAQDGSIQCPRDVFFPDKTLDPAQVRALEEIGGRVIVEELRQFRTAITQLGAPFLTFERLVTLLEQAMVRQAPEVLQVREARLESFYRPLWGMINDLLPDSATPSPSTKTAIQRLLVIPLVVTEKLRAVTISQSFVAPATLDAGRVASLLPRLAIASRHILGFLKIARLIRQLDLGAVVNHINSMRMIKPVEDVITVERKELRELYAMFADLDRHVNADKTVYQALRGLPIWLSSRGLIKATQALLPGNFTDPTGQAELLETSVLTDSAREFVSSKLGVQTQTIEAFVQNVLPRFFNDSGPLDTQKYARLISELASHPALVNDDDIRHRLGSLSIVPTQDGGWSRPTNTYRRTDELVKILGDAKHLWLDASRVPNTRSIHAFIDNLGIRRSPIPRHLVDRMLNLAEKHTPSEEARRAGGDAFYVLCDGYEEWKGEEFFKSAIANLRNTACFPALNDSKQWHSASSLHAPYRAEAFESQAKILDFRSMARLNRDLLKDLGVRLEPKTQLVINHLRHCVTLGKPAPFTTYQILNERTKDDGALIRALSGEQCIYVESQKAYVRSNQLFWLPQQLGRYAFTIPGNLESFKPLFTAIGVKNAPEGRDFIDILLDIVGEYFEQSKAVEGADRSVYDVCLIGISASEEREELNSMDMRRVQEAPTILNLAGQPTLPDEVLLKDSEWHAGFFRDEIDRALCKPAPELWQFIEKVGVKRLSESAEVALEFVDGPKSDEPQIAEKLTERIDILARLLHDKPTTIKQKVRESISELTAVSYELVRIQASVHIGEALASAPPSPAQAFYDIDKRQLILARPVGDRSWSHVLNAIFHQLMPEEPGSEISKLTLSLRPLMSLPVDEAHRELTDAGIPYLDAGKRSACTDDLTSSSLDDMGSRTDSGDQLESKPTASPTDNPKSDEHTPNAPQTSRPTGKPQANPKDVMPADKGPRKLAPIAAEENDADIQKQTITPDDNNDLPTGGKRAKKPRPKHKEQWDRRLISYVRKKQEGSTDSEEQENSSEHNLAVEVVARDAVCTYEKARGRDAEQMPQTHPAYDIISRNPLTGERRYIEVKGVYGEWNQTGVGLSRLQFSNAQDYGDRYWLYVVEFISDPQHIRIHPIRSPATQVTSFMFDGNWRDAAADERADPSLAFTVGARVKHEQYGYGRIESVEQRGLTRLMSIEFDTRGRCRVALNLKMMTVVEEADEHNNS